MSAPPSELTAGPLPSRPRASSGGIPGGAALGRGVAMTYLSVIVLLPLAAVAVKSLDGGLSSFLDVVTGPQALAAFRLTLIASLVVVAINAVTGTLIAWVLVRDEFRGKGVVNALIDLPFALPTIVAGLTLLALYGPKHPVGIDISYTRVAVGLALLFVTLPFVVRAVQPVLMTLDREMEEAAASLGATPLQTFRRVILPNLLPALLSGVALAFARAIGEFGSIVLISGNIPFKTEVASVFISGRIEGDDLSGASAVSVVLLLLTLAILAALGGVARWRSRHEG
ncbi:MAG: sulfate/thiosulfate transport system permease protein [Thermoleophilaceae bacterium]|nr:sulfate/thiosulfate transport system permease protein [Thermoleophilaceae bacterium]